MGTLTGLKTKVQSWTFQRKQQSGEVLLFDLSQFFNIESFVSYSGMMHDSKRKKSFTLIDSKPAVSRRQALKYGTTAVAVPMILPNTLLGRSAPSNTMRLGCIGTGRMGRGDMQNALYRGLDESANARIVAVCDLDINRAQSAKKLVESKYLEEFGKGKFDVVNAYGDFRELLARDDIDGVTISTPDHWHALLAIAAAKSGKSIYLQKPLTYSVVEGQELVKAVRLNKVILQTGSQQRSSVYFRKTCELVRNGHLGQLHTIEVGIPTDQGSGVDRPMKVPTNLNYKMWLGPTPEQEYTEHRVHPIQGFGRPGWLQIEAYCRGMITGWGAHMYDIAQWGLGLDKDSGPTQIQVKADFPDRGLFDVHTSFTGEAVYANGVRLKSSNGKAGVKFIGDQGWIWVERGSFSAHDRSIFRKKASGDDVKLYESKDHMLNFLQCMRTGREPIAPVEAGHRSNTVCVLHHIAMKLGRKLRWDAKAELFIDDNEANKLLDFPHRAPWKL